MTVKELKEYIATLDETMEVHIIDECICCTRSLVKQDLEVKEYKNKKRLVIDW